MTPMIVTAAGFTELDSRRVRFIHWISKYGELCLILFSDSLIHRLRKSEPKFSESERRYFLESIRYVNCVHTINNLSQLQHVSEIINKPVEMWFTLDLEMFDGCAQLAQQQGIDYRICCAADLTEHPEHDYTAAQPPVKKVLVTGSFDWFHSGHVRFFEEASEYGDLYVVVGHDKNIEKLKGPGHPMFPEQERKYMAGAIRYVKRVLISSGNGWLDAEPEIQKIRPDYYVVNEDGDKEVKRHYCESHGIEYVVLKREPKPGIIRRTSTDLRGF